MGERENEVRQSDRESGRMILGRQPERERDRERERQRERERERERESLNDVYIEHSLT